MDKAAFVVFASEVRTQLGEIEATLDRAEQRARESGPAGDESLGFQLHNLYCACEDLFRIIAAAFENRIDDTGGYHIEMLRRMRTEIPGVRPKLLSDASHSLLDSLRAFRHVFRHAYGVPLDARKLRIVLDDARTLRPILTREIDAFLEKIAGQGE